ncbi:hypothetical protein [Staphylococcus succinus]
MNPIRQTLTKTIEWFFKPFSLLRYNYTFKEVDVIIILIIKSPVQF